MISVTFAFPATLLTASLILVTAIVGLWIFKEGHDDYGDSDDDDSGGTGHGNNGDDDGDDHGGGGDGCAQLLGFDPDRKEITVIQSSSRRARTNGARTNGARTSSPAPVPRNKSVPDQTKGRNEDKLAFGGSTVNQRKLFKADVRKFLKIVIGVIFLNTVIDIVLRLSDVTNTRDIFNSNNTALWFSAAKLEQVSGLVHWFESGDSGAMAAAFVALITIVTGFFQLLNAKTSDNEDLLITHMKKSKKLSQKGD